MVKATTPQKENRGMMNHHLSAMPHGPPPMPPPRRQHEVPYSSAPPNVRAQGYMGYQHPQAHSNGSMPPPYGAHHYQQWYQYHQVPAPHPPQPYQPYAAPLIVSSYPRSQPPPATMPAPPPPPPPLPPLPPLPTQPSATSTTPLPSSFSSTPPSVATSASGASDAQDSLPTTASVDPPLNLPTTPSVNAQTSPETTAPPLSPILERTKEMPLARRPFQPPLPWLSVPETPFPAKAPRRWRKARALQTSATPVEFPAKGNNDVSELQEDLLLHEPKVAPSEPETPTTSHPPSETGSTQPTTPSSAVPPQTSSRTQQAPAPSGTGPVRPVIPVVPVVPIYPPTPSTPRHGQQGAIRPSSFPPKSPVTSPRAATEDEQQAPASSEPAEPSAITEEPSKAISPPRPAPKSWADLVRTKPPATGDAVATSTAAGGVVTSKNESLVDVLNNLGADGEHHGNKIAFVEPRGLVNTGNMCYMNSVLQILVFCVPFYEFLERVSRRSHSFKSEFPLIDAMITFMKEFRVIDAATSVEQLRFRLKQNELEQYGDSFSPEYVYRVIRDLPRFRDMRRGHQQDAQEFLGFLLEELHEECVNAMKQTALTTSGPSTPPEADVASVSDEPSADGWLEVGHKQKPAVTRSSGHINAESPITRIFGGKIRSEFRVPGNKNSVTLEPYQSLQLDIGSPQVNNIIDALKGLTKSETMQGDFNSSRGPKVNATKQVFIESLPPVLILHLKRFQYEKGTQKIWKKVGYPLELDIPKDVFPSHRRNVLSAPGGLPKYRLIGVIYHHGKNASGGHYTVDIRRQDDREWIRLDDTVIRRVRSEEVALAGSEEDPKILAAALERHKLAEKTPHANMFEQFDQDDQEQEENEKGWSQVNGTGSSSHVSKKSVTAANGNASPPAMSGASSGKRTPNSRYGIRENKVAYLLFYQRTGSSS